MTYVDNFGYQKAVNEILKPFTDLNDFLNRLTESSQWNKEKIRAMNLWLLEQPLSTDLITVLYRWSLFLSHKTSSVEKLDCILISKVDEEFGRTISDCFGFVETVPSLSYSLWASIAPNMLMQVRHSYFSSLIKNFTSTNIFEKSINP